MARIPDAAAARDEDVPLLSNNELARIFHEIGDLLEVKGELVFKTVAYHRAADAIAHSPIELARAYREGDPPRIAGIGTAIADKLDELARTSRLGFHERLLAEFPPTLVELLEVPGIGPRTVRLLYERLGVSSLDQLRDAANAGRIRTVRGLTERTERSILEGIAALEARPKRLLLGEADAIVRALVGELSAVPGVRGVEPAGSFRRRRETIGDIDLLAATDDPELLMDRFTNLGAVDRVVGRGPARAAIRLLRGPQVDLMIMAPGSEGTYRIHFTGSKEHNVRLRGLARDRGWSLSEKGFLRLGPDGEPATGSSAELRAFATEAEAYAFLDLAEIEPELREDRGEVEAAARDALPSLVRLDDLRGDLHTHSDWTDGNLPIEVLVERYRERGLAYQVLTDHTAGLAIARGLTPERFAEQRGIVDALNARFADEEDAGHAPPGTPSEGFRVLHGCELEIRADGSLDLPDEVLARFDVVVASLHVARRQARAQLTQRVLNAIRSPHVDVIAHPAGRMLTGRADLDLDWDVVYAEAARTGTLLEINGSDHRLDLADVRARRALEAGCRFALDSDAHKLSELDNLRWAVAIARRAWIEPGVVANTWSRARLLEWVGGKADRL